MYTKTFGLMLLAFFCVEAAVLQRARRDVAHLPLEYLPPVVLPPLPSRAYLPPVEQHAASLPHVLAPPRDYLPPVEQLKLNNEYLPPAELEETTTTTATSTTTTEEPTTETVPATTTEAEPEPTTAAPVEVKTQEHLEQGVLHSDGYHYNTPEFVPDLTPELVPDLTPESVPDLKLVDRTPEAPAVEAYLPPLEDNAVVEVEQLPESEETAALLDDGYHYRAIRRLRF